MPSGWARDRSGGGPRQNFDKRISRAREAVPQGGPACTKNMAGLHSHCMTRSCADLVKRFNRKIVDFGRLVFAESTPKLLRKPRCFNAAVRPPVPEKSSMQQRSLTVKPKGSHSLCSPKACGLPHPFLQQIWSPLLHRCPGFARVHPCWRLKS